jgi:hypothetical protein
MIVQGCDFSVVLDHLSYCADGAGDQYGVRDTGEWVEREDSRDVECISDLEIWLGLCVGYLIDNGCIYLVYCADHSLEVGMLLTNATCLTKTTAELGSGEKRIKLTIVPLRPPSTR